MTEPPSLAEAARVWARVAALSFGGPAGQIAVMHRIVVEEKGWIDEAAFLHALGFCTLLPGPEAQQLATYLGWRMHGTRGGLIAGGLFIAPGFLTILALSLIYARFGAVDWVTAAFLGLRAAVLAIVAQAVLRLGQRSLRHGLLIGLAGSAFFALALFAAPFPAVVLTAGVLGATAAAYGVPGFGADGDAASKVVPVAHGSAIAIAATWLAIWLVPMAAVLVWAGADSSLGGLALLFSKMAVVTFGGAYAALAYVAQQAVQIHGWLRPSEMLDGLGLAETTPGPLIMVLEFVGFMAAFRAPAGLPPFMAGALGAVIATWATFAPCFLWIFLCAPYVERLRGVRAAQGALKAITAAVVGVILNLAVWLAIHTLFREVAPVRGLLTFDVPLLSSLDPASALLAATAALAVFGFRVGIPWVIAGGAVAGMLMHVLPAQL